MLNRTLQNRIERAEQVAKAKQRFSTECICFPEDEPPFFAFGIELEMLTRVKCPLHGERFTPRYHIFVAKWLRAKQPQHLWTHHSKHYRKAWFASFPSDLWPAEEEEDPSGRIFLKLKDGTRLLASEPAWMRKAQGRRSLRVKPIPDNLRLRRLSTREHLLFVGMLVAYYFLARVEERRMLVLYPGQAEYLQHTGMFLPGNPGTRIYKSLFGGMRNRRLAYRLAVASSVVGILLAGIGMRAYTVRHVSMIDAAKMEVLSVYPMTAESMQHVAVLALADPRVKEALGREGQATFVAHILPRDYGMIGMFADIGSRHMTRGNVHLSRFKYLAGCLLPFLDVHQRTDLMGSEGQEYRVVFSRVDGPNGKAVSAAHLFDLSAKMTPVYVADVNAASSEVSETLAPPRRSYWGDVKMPIF